MDLAEKEKIIEELKAKLVKLIGVKADLRRDEDLLKHVNNLMK